MKIWNTVEDVLADFEADRPKPPPKPEPTVLKVATDRKLSVEGQRERVVNEAKQLVAAEKKAAEEQLDPNDYRVKRERDREAGKRYREIYETVAWAEHYARQRVVDHGNYDPIALFERQMRSEIE
jgi:hypothetical protein